MLLWVGVVAAVGCATIAGLDDEYAVGDPVGAGGVSAGGTGNNTSTAGTGTGGLGGGGPCSDEPSWWNSDFGFRRPLVLTPSGSAAVPAGYSVFVELDHAALVTAGRARNDGDDLRIVHVAGPSATELDRRLVGIGSAATQVWFMTVDPTASPDDSYFLYYGHPQATAPPAHWADSMGAETPSRVYLAADDFEEHTDGTCPDGWSPCDGSFEVASDSAGRHLVSFSDGRYFFAGDSSWGDVLLEVRTRSPTDDACWGVATRVVDEQNLVFTGYNCGSPPELPAFNVAAWERHTGTGGYTAYTNAAVAQQLGGWHVQAVGWVGMKTHLFHDGAFKTSGDAPVTAAPQGNVAVFSSYGTEHRIDDVVVRRFVFPEPTVTLGETEVPCD